MSKELREKIIEADNFYKLLEKKINEHLIVSKKDGKEILFAKHCHLGLEHYLAIVTLLHFKINGSAFALLRCLFESFVRAVRFFYDEKVSQVDSSVDISMKDVMNISGLLKGNLLKGNKSIPEFVKRTFERVLEDRVVDSGTKTIWGWMCSYNHGGLAQISRRATSDFIESNFSEEEVTQLISLAVWFVRDIFILMFHVSEKNDVLNKDQDFLEKMECFLDNLGLKDSN